MKHQKGYTQIEVLVSILVLAIGFLGMAGLQTTSLQNSSRSVLRTQASYLSYEILDKMRVNADQGSAYVTASSSTTFSSTDCVANACDAGALAVYDVTEWKCALGSSSACSALPSAALISADNALPNGEGTITKTGDIYTITVQWNEERDGTTGTLQSFQLETTL